MSEIDKKDRISANEQNLPTEQAESFGNKESDKDALENRLKETQDPVEAEDIRKQIQNLKTQKATENRGNVVDISTGRNPKSILNKFFQGDESFDDLKVTPDIAAEVLQETIDMDHDLPKAA